MHLATTYVWLWLSVGINVCAENPKTHREFNAQEHRHITAFAQAVGEVAPGDKMIFSVDGNVVDLSAETISHVSFPGGLGRHVIVATWTDKDGNVKKTSDRSVTVHPWASCR